jgi:Lignostilbene-alpha,beta-dioxygenase and related enzymes
MPAHNRFLEGSFAPVTEEITAFDLPITGRPPAELSGRYLRNGPNPLGRDDPNYGKQQSLGSGSVGGCLPSPDRAWTRAWDLV